jgi:ubiquitin-conjugating enzyme E2 variant
MDERSTPLPPIVQQDAARLAAGYTSGFRAGEILAITGFFALSLLLAIRLAPRAADTGAVIVFAIFLGWFAADFVSGLVHWAGDTWGSTDLPLLGQTLIRTFREHHVDQKAITRHDFVETNGTNCMATLPFLSGSLLVDLSEADPLRVLVVAFSLSLSLWVFLTNQVHKWAHQDTPPRVVAWLQRAHLVLPPAHHAAHHAAPYDRAYCITTGWMNPVLARFGFFRRAEAVITALTGSVPRRDDIGLAAAMELAPRE